MKISRRQLLVLMPSLAVLRGPQSPGGWESRVTSASSASDAPNVSVASGAPISPRAPVVSFHLDQPYLDFTGLEEPYVPPAGLRSGAPLAGLSEQEVLSRFYGFI